LAMVELWKPVPPVKLSVGHNRLALATPMLAVAFGPRLAHAAGISVLRPRRFPEAAPAAPAGTRRRFISQRRGLREKVEAGWPTRSAMACSYWARWMDPKRWACARVVSSSESAWATFQIRVNSRFKERLGGQNRERILCNF